jgi:hypothetical protein
MERSVQLIEVLEDAYAEAVYDYVQTQNEETVTRLAIAAQKLARYQFRRGKIEDGEIYFISALHALERNGPYLAELAGAIANDYIRLFQLAMLGRDIQSLPGMT